MSQTETKKIHYTKSYKIDPFIPTEFEAQIGTVKGLLDDDFQALYIIIDHPKRFMEKVKYRTIIVDDDEEFDISNYTYVGTYIKTTDGARIKHLYIKIIYEDGEERLRILPR